jgi:hypothetical protein
MNIEKFTKEMVKQIFVDNNSYLNDCQKIFCKLIIDGCSTIYEVSKITGILFIHQQYITMN